MTSRERYKYKETGEPEGLSQHDIPLTNLNVVVVVHWVATRCAGMIERRQWAAVATRPSLRSTRSGQRGVGSAGLAGGARHHWHRGVGSGPMGSSPGQTM